ncbi:amino acid adenylation domain-containing protein [Lentzea atacamensis]|uniref:Amino acid adenylation domain-containing protein n=1 Tax=Lentzea atacamensis TaxID=531938 RepID=A0A316HJJ4_9PSEU|nr:amino acid adenylation domain-containing protein [Lentzea atacamensis]PWK81387.1 amino acid adenylation domain-containing protein [Lentzea atacamensis]
MKAEFHDSALRDLPLLDRALFQSFGAGPIRIPPFHHIHHAVGQQAARHPDLTAVEHLGESITYAELDRRAELLAEFLTRAGVRPGDQVGLFLTRSIPMVVGILGILKAGAAYVPQDVRIAPAVHLRHIVRTASINFVLTTSEHRSALPDNLATVIAIDEVPDTTRFCRTFTEDSDIAAVIFTSGTTGRPNGVRVSHANLCNVLLTAPGCLGVAPGTRVSQLLNIAFDMAMWEILGTLAHGGTLVIRGSDIERTASTVDVVIATPSVLASLDPAVCRRVRTVAVAGERCPQALADAWSRHAVFHNSCGPTEVTIVNTVQRYEPGGPLTIGRPVPNTTVYVLDDDLRPCRIGEIGEMWAGGECVTAGYLGDPELTAARYLPDPFLGGDRLMFRTRDLGRWTHDGQLEHHGRTDDQVKVRGFRVELDAVTSALESATDCSRATTLLHNGSLVGFISPASAAPEEARRAVEELLPYYCVPTLIVPVDTLPTTDRGKVDRRALLSRLDGQKETVA